ncbi:hypothetical protein [Pasteurella atlantica]|uniref:hypothetical protein n=1 Tax=Pasteurellaceae TaxID=712 RepID=UPI002774CE03|nr:hypothetical protein [Pasteurella atlantica]MDP8100055.1 hypothetical protein [Pasteurella atlantica]MDP8107965.1 hypothetical protein [Pasteurella atlantica]MDP8117667.1 hypothetical protein [Pasteurella atlantica]
MDTKIAHLNMIQGVINRMANNSFLLKGWSITIVSALFALATQEKGQQFLYLTILPCLMFWGLDGYFLWQERMYRKLYQVVADKDEKDIDFSMNATIYKKDINCWFCVVFSKTLLAFHGIILAIIILFILILYFS